jgi:hypothetical protein
MWLRFIINLIFLIIQIYIYKLLEYIEEQGENCPCSSGWKLAQVKLITNIMILLNVINMFVPLNSGLHNIPLIGGSISLIYLLLLSLELVLVSSITKEFDTPNCKDCNTEEYQSIVNFFQGSSYIGCIVYAGFSSIIQLYF